MDFRDAAESGFRRYADFNGRSARSEFWYWILFFYVIWFAVLVCLAIGAAIGEGFDHVVGLVVVELDRR